MPLTLSTFTPRRGWVLVERLVEGRPGSSLYLPGQCEEGRTIGRVLKVGLNVDPAIQPGTLLYLERIPTWHPSGHNLTVSGKLCALYRQGDGPEKKTRSGHRHRPSGGILGIVEDFSPPEGATFGPTGAASILPPETKSESEEC